MDGLWNPAANSTLRNELFGFTTYTLLAILGLLVMIFIVRLLTMRFAPTVLTSLNLRQRRLQNHELFTQYLLRIGAARALLDPWLRPPHIAENLN